ncbi:M1 family metallopeptidase [Candidatus Korobacter versatilis]|nr:M1 family metallopeptidase [Candidatus Koribacter versatilis]
MKKLLLLFALMTAATFCSAQRLPGNVVPDHYSLKFAPDFSSSTFQGDETIDVRVLSATDAIVLNALELEIKSATVTVAGKELTASVTADAENETVTLHVPSQLTVGSATIHIGYTGRLNDKLRGLYRSEANNRRYAVSQFEAVDARVAFPSFDEPSYKATFDITTVVDQGDTAISNGRIVSDEPGPAGKHTIKFSTTPKMSSYLVALTVGDWKCISGEQDGIALRICSVPGKEQQGAFALEATKAILHFYNQYFGIKYPYGKLDQIAAPDFEAGAMENTAAIVYRESALLLDPAKASVNDQKEISSVIAHEMAHQWFGDLVTMKWWNDIWLNEGFATWMESKPVAAWKPEWQISQDDVLGSSSALNTDSTQNTRPIRQQAETRNEINALFDGIAYGKTAAVLRMLEGYIGPEVFRKGVNSYLEAHKYGNATAEDFWGAMAKASGRPIDKLMPTFVTQPGAAYIALTDKCENNETVGTITQQRFYSSPKLMQSTSDQLWQVPVCSNEIGGAGTASCELLTQKQQSFKLKGCGHGVMGNSKGSGYYRYSFDPAEYQSPNFKMEELPEEDQVSLVGNEGALLAAGVHHIQDFMAMTEKFRGVPTYGAVSELADHLTFADRHLVSDQDREQFRSWVRSVFKPTLEKVGTVSSKSDTPGQRNTRATLVELLGNVGEDPDAIALAKQTVNAYMQDPASVDTTLVDASFPVAAAHGDASLYDIFLAKTKQASSPQDYYRYVHALRDFRDPVLLKRTLEWTLGPEVRNQDLRGLVGVLSNPAGQQLTWDFIRQRWSDIQNKAGQSIVGAQLAYYAIGVFCDAEHAKEAQSFIDQHRVQGLDRIARQQMERVGQCIDLRQREEPNLARFLQKSGNGSGQH